MISIYHEIYINYYSISSNTSSPFLLPTEKKLINIRLLFTFVSPFSYDKFSILLLWGVLPTAGRLHEALQSRFFKSMRELTPVSGPTYLSSRPHLARCQDYFSQRYPDWYCIDVRARVSSRLGRFFLDASSHLYMRSCPSVGWMDGWSVGWSVGP